MNASEVANQIDSQKADDGDQDEKFDAADGKPGGNPFIIYPILTGVSSQPGSGGEKRQTRSQRRKERSRSVKRRSWTGVDREGFERSQEGDLLLAKIRREAINDVGKAVVGQSIGKRTVVSPMGRGGYPRKKIR